MVVVTCLTIDVKSGTNVWCEHGCRKIDFTCCGGNVVCLDVNNWVRVERL